MKSLVYFSFKYLFRYFNYVYFRSVKVYGYENIPKNGGVLFSPNHQGALLDPLLVGSMTPKKLTSLTRSDVFKSPFKWFFNACQMLPVYRIRDGYQNLKKNDFTFKKCYEILGNGDFMLMFSEGGHHNEYYLKNLSKGSSRLAFNAHKENPTKKIYLQPVGINYGHHQQPQCSLHLVFGSPIEIGESYDVKLTDAENINKIRKELQNRMKDCLWLPENTEKYQIQKQKINRETTELEFDQLKASLNTSFNKLPNRKKKSSLIHFLAIALSLPNLIPLWITRKVIGKFKDIVFTSSMKYSLGLFLFPIWWLGTAIPIAYGYGNSTMTTYLLVSILSLFIRQRILLS